MNLTDGEMARALGCSRPSVVTYRQRGMPMHSLEEARRWRAAHVRPKAPMPKPPNGWRHSAEPDWEGAPVDLRREPDAGDAFEHVACIAHREPARYVPALVHLLLLLTDEQYARMRRSGLVSRPVWDAIGEAWQRLYERDL